MFLGLYLISTWMRSRYAPSGLDIEFLRTTGGYAVIGLVTGLLSSIFVLASGVLLIGALILLSGMPPGESIVVSLIVTTLASIIPSLAHASRGGVDTGAGVAMILGGALGGFGGGYLLAKLAAAGSPIPVIIFALTAIFLSAWTAWRMQ
jgi:uncharacterized membrane protein YfcA